MGPAEHLLARRERLAASRAASTSPATAARTAGRFSSITTCPEPERDDGHAIRRDRGEVRLGAPPQALGQHVLVPLGAHRDHGQGPQVVALGPRDLGGRIDVEQVAPVDPVGVARCRRSTAGTARSRLRARTRSGAARRSRPGTRWRTGARRTRRTNAPPGRRAARCRRPRAARGARPPRPSRSGPRPRVGRRWSPCPRGRRRRRARSPTADPAARRRRSSPPSRSPPR